MRVLLEQACWTGGELAAEVNRVGAESGLGLAYDRSAVAHWLQGTQPRPPVPELIAEAFTRRLDRPVELFETGLSPCTQPGGVPTPAEPGGAESGQESAMALLRRLAGTQSDSPRRRIPREGGGVLVTAALAAPRFDQARQRPVAPLTDLSGSGRIEASEVQAAEALAVVFSDADIAFGGGHSRAALAGYLSTHLAPMLERPASPALRRRLLTVTGELAYLCAFMCYDDHLHAYAQRYYRLALRIAVENADASAYAVALRGLSVQARTLGHHTQAVDLAETAIADARPNSTTGAFLYGQLAVAHAANGSRNNALHALNTAERALDRATTATPPVTAAYHQASLLHQQASVLALLGDCAGSITTLRSSLHHRPDVERRSRAITTARLAELHLRQGHLDHALTTWHQFLDDYPALTSARADTALATLRSYAHRHAAYPAARNLYRRADSVIGRTPHR